MKAILRALVLPSAALLIAAGLLSIWHLAMPSVLRPLVRFAEALFWIAAAWWLLRLLDAALWQRLPESRRPPRLATDLLAGIVLAATILFVLAEIFNLPVTSIVTTSGIAVAVLGFALRDMLASIFSGIALNIEQPYQIGDWLECEGGPAGRVSEIGWLTTRLVTLDRTCLVVPNARLSSLGFHNFGHKGQRFRDNLVIVLDHAVAPERVERILRAALAEIPDVAEMRPSPDVVIDGIEPNGVRWRLRYWLDDYRKLVELRHKVHRTVLRHLDRAGIALPYFKLDLFHERMPPRDLGNDENAAPLLARQGLFRALCEEEIASLALAARRRRIPAGEAVVTEGEAGLSLFVVVEGVLAVRARKDGEICEVGRLAAGDSFGEFSLLTGEPRSATVTARSDVVLFEITRDHLRPILERRPELAERLSRELAARRRATSAVFASTGVAAHEAEPHPPHALLERIRTFFHL